MSLTHQPEQIEIIRPTRHACEHLRLLQERNPIQIRTRAIHSPRGRRDAAAAAAKPPRPTAPGKVCKLICMNEYAPRLAAHSFRLASELMPVAAAAASRQNIFDFERMHRETDNFRTNTHKHTHKHSTNTIAANRPHLLRPTVLIFWCCPTDQRQRQCQRQCQQPHYPLALSMARVVHLRAMSHGRHKRSSNRLRRSRRCRRFRQSSADEITADVCNYVSELSG